MQAGGPTSAAIANRVDTDAAIAINAVTSRKASMAVIWTGSAPKHADRRGVDILGKTDPLIARLNADISGAGSWEGMISVPGHSKYNLKYSILELRPTHIQAFAAGAADGDARCDGDLRASGVSWPGRDQDCFPA